MNKAAVEVYHLVDGHYQRLPANDRGHYPINSMGVELGIWQGQYGNMELPWLRWWDKQGNLLLTGSERCLRQATLTQQLESQLQQQRQRSEQLAERLRQMGINFDEIY